MATVDDIQVGDIYESQYDTSFHIVILEVMRHGDGSVDKARVDWYNRGIVSERNAVLPRSSLTEKMSGQRFDFSKNLRKDKAQDVIKEIDIWSLG